MRLFLILLTFCTISLFSKEFKDSDGYFRYVQVLAIRDFSRAKIVMNKLEKNGYEYIVRDSIKKGEQYFRVVVGPFSKNSIKEEQKKLNKLLYLKSSFILTYDEKPTDTVNYKKNSINKRVINFKKDGKSEKQRVDYIVKLSFTRDSFLRNKNFVCSELNDLVSKDYPPAILLLASNYIKGDECVEQNLSKAIDYLKKMQKEDENLPKNLVKFSKELLAETYIKTLERNNFLKAKKIFDELLLDETNSDKYTIYLYKRLAYIEYFLKEYKYMNLWLLEAAKLDDIESQINLSKNYISGLGFEKDLEKAIYWLEQCIEKDKKCGENLGIIYMNINYEIAPNLDKAFISFAKAVTQGSLKAKKVLDNRDEIEEFFSLMQRDEIQYKLVVEYLKKYIKESLNNIFITSINQRGEEFDVFISFSTDSEERVAKMVFLKNRHKYWVVNSFNTSNSILTLR